MLDSGEGEGGRGFRRRQPPRRSTRDCPGSEQRPDDTEGHGIKFRQDPDAADEDQIGDDTEGHGYRWGQDTEAVDETQAADDTEGHGWRL